MDGQKHYASEAERKLQERFRMPKPPAPPAPAPSSKEADEELRRDILSDKL